MHAIDDTEFKRYRAIRAALGATILAGVVAGLAAIGAQAPERQHMTLNCAYEPGAAGTMNDALSEIPDACAPNPATPATPPPGAAARYGVPDAAASLDPRAQPEPLPPTF